MALEGSPFVAGFIASCAIGRRFVVTLCVLALVLLGQAFVGHAHAVEPASALSVITSSESGGHCPGPMHMGETGQSCVSTHAHAWCVLSGTVFLMGAPERGWCAPYEPHAATVTTAPVLRPPIHLVA